jgi:hypothetical protein
MIVEAVKRLRRILDAEGNPLQIKISRNLEQGTVKTFTQN